jgi:hypothetical protein
VDGDHWDDAITAQVDVTFPRGQTFADWLHLPAVNATSGWNPARISVLQSRRNMHNPAGWPNDLPAQRWIYTYQDQPDEAILHVTFDTPWGAPSGQQCGRVLFSSFHVTNENPNGSGNTLHTNGMSFPDECTTEFTAQEKVLAYDLFDLTSCVQPPLCTPITCADQGLTCGQAGDGCGGTLTCGPACPPTTCVPAVCPADFCGTYPDGCGNTLTCEPPGGCMS